MGLFEFELGPFGERSFSFLCPVQEKARKGADSTAEDFFVKNYAPILIVYVSPGVIAKE